MLRGTVRLSVLLAMSAVLSCLFSALALIHAGDTVRTGILADHGQICSVGFNKNKIYIYTRTGKKIYGYKAGDSNSKIFSSFISDLDADGTDELLLVVGKDKNEYGEYLLILKPELALQGAISGTNAEKPTIGDADAQPAAVSDIQATLGLKQIYRFDMKEINPWKVQTCDVDGDGSKEISVGVYKKAVFHPVMAKRPFIYNWSDGHMSPKWLGSRLARPFDDYVFCDINSDGKDELISEELIADGSKAINTYGWKGFGFESTGGSGSYEDILKIRKITGPAIEINAVMDGRSKWIALHYVNGTLVEEQ